jgi:tRNA (guanine37-N1)-methyltransferase
VLNEYVDQELSIGDYVLSGGELGALVCIDAIARFIPGVLGHSDSAEKDSFSEGLLEHPNYTRPRTFLDQEVPEVLLGGNHKAIADCKKKVSALVTLKKRPDLFKEFIKKENANYQKIRRKKSLSPIEDLKVFLRGLSDHEKIVLGLDGLQEEDLNV